MGVRRAKLERNDVLIHHTTRKKEELLADGKKEEEEKSAHNKIVGVHSTHPFFFLFFCLSFFLAFQVMGVISMAEENSKGNNMAHNDRHTRIMHDRSFLFALIYIELYDYL